MEYLLDTHTFLWFINGDDQLSANARTAIMNGHATKYISIASFWEIAIKVNIGKLQLDMPFEELRQHVVSNGLEILPITFEHTVRLCSIDAHHGDPSDRIIIAQALADKLTVISKDKNFPKYKPLRLMW